MNAQLLNILKQNRTLVVNRYNELLKDASMGKNYITSEKFFFTVVANHFEEMSTVMINKVNKGGYIVFIRELNKAIEKAEYACAKPERENNRQYFNK